jgi:hypothetical protein
VLDNRLVFSGGCRFLNLTLLCWRSRVTDTSSSTLLRTIMDTRERHEIRLSRAQAGRRLEHTWSATWCLFLHLLNCCSGCMASVLTTIRMLSRHLSQLSVIGAGVDGSHANAPARRLWNLPPRDGLQTPPLSLALQAR